MYVLGHNRFVLNLNIIVLQCVLLVLWQQDDSKITAWKLFCDQSY